MSFQIEQKPQRISSLNHNYPKCGYKYKSLRSYSSDIDANIIQINDVNTAIILGILGITHVAILPKNLRIAMDFCRNHLFSILELSDMV